MQGAAATIRHEMIGLAGVIERNVYLIKRYIWWDARVLHLDGREHADYRLHLQGHPQPHARRGEPADHRCC